MGLSASAPHGVPMYFQLVDRILERRPDGIVTAKAVTAAEEYLKDHFPDFPILPGVMMLEALVQAGRAWAAGLAGDEGFGAAERRPMVIAETRQVVYASMVRPGEVLRAEVTCRGRDDDGVFRFQGRGVVCRVGGPPRGAADGAATESEAEAVKARFSLRPIEPADVVAAGRPPEATTEAPPVP